jgi:LacI family transcriptional regulator, repressor for deo operon, udp, cdd, tsx, nupC, and nupG
LNITEIAQICGVSIATVSRVINNNPRVAKKTRLKVMKVIEENDFVPNTSGRHLRTSRSNKIMVMLPTFSNQFYSVIVEGIEEQADKMGYQVVVVTTMLKKSLEQKYLDMLRAKQVDGCINFFSTFSNKEIDDLAARFPYVQGCEPTLDSKVSSVVIDNKMALYSACRDFIKDGHTRIAYLSGDYYKHSEKRREQGYKNALEEAGIAFDPNLLAKTSYHFKDGMHECERMMNLDKAPTAFLAASDPLAIGAANYLLSAGYKVGKDVMVMGFDNSSISKYFVPAISTIAQPRFSLGTTAFDLLYEKIKNLNSPVKKTVLPFELIHRESTGKIGKHIQ